MSTSSENEYIVFGKPFIGEEEIDEVVASLRAAWLGTGPKVRRFETEFAQYLGAQHAAAFHSCTAALFLAQKSLGLGPGDAVVTTPLTFVATANSIRHCGAEPLFVDVCDRTGLLDPAAVEEFLDTQCSRDGEENLVHRETGLRVRGVLPVHLWGQVADMDAFRKLAKKHGLWLVEDAAHAIESWCGNEKVGTTADVSCFSFYATKNICTGEGGMLTTADGELAARARRLAQHGLDNDAWKRFSDDGYKHYVAVESGWKFNMMDLQAALGIHQLARVETQLEERTRQWYAYLEDLQDLPGVSLPPAEAEHGRHARHLFTLTVTPSARLRRDAVLTELHARGIGSGVHYLSVTRHPAFGSGPTCHMPVAERIGDQTVSLPIGGALTEEKRQRVVREVRAVLGG